MAGVALLLTPASAGAATTCSYDGGSQSLTVSMGAGGDVAHLGVNAAAIEVRNKNFSLVSCAGGSPTTVNTDGIAVTDNSGGSTTADIDNPDSFNGGPPEGLNDAEIEIGVSLGTGARDELRLEGASAGARFVYGTAGINTSVSAESLPDPDVTPSGVERNSASARGFNSDFFSGAGGSGTGGAFPRRLELDGGFGDDTLTGGTKADTLSGSFDADLIKGGRGRDTALYDYFCNPGCPVRVDIGSGTGNDGGDQDESQSTPGTFDTVKGDVENLIGGNSNDKLVGNGRANVLTGGTGRDRLIGRGGNDRLKAKDFVQDLKLDCGRGKRDAVRRDRFDPTPKSC